MTTSTNNHPYDIALSILQKVSCILSSLGSLMIILSIHRSKTNKVKTQQKFLLGISYSDLITSVTWIFSDVLMPPIGNEHSCNAQGFFIQVGVSSGILLMVALQLQYVLAIKYGWREKALSRLHILLCIPFIYGFGTAIAASVLDLYNPATWSCWIAPHPIECTSTYAINMGYSDLKETDCVRGDNARIYQFAFFYIPLWVSIAFCLAAMLLVARSVKATEKKTARRSMSTLSRKDSKNNEHFSNSAFKGDIEGSERPEQVNDTFPIRDKAVRKTSIILHSGSVFQSQNMTPALALTSRVRTQCILYAMGFLIVWSFSTVFRFAELMGWTVHPILSVLAGFFLGSQGVWNAVIYFRPKYKKVEKRYWWEKIWVLVKTNLFFCETCSFKEDYHDKESG